MFLLLSILSILSIFFPSFNLGLHCVCPSTVLPVFRTTTLCYCCVNFVICDVNFLYFRARYFGVILVFFGAGRYFLPSNFDGDDSISNSILCGFFTVSDTSYSHFLGSTFGSPRFLRGFLITVSVIFIHLTLEFHSLLIHTTLHFILL